MTDFLFLDFKITADGDCSHEIRRQLLLGRKVITNLDSVLKSRDFTLPTNVYVVFPVAMYCSESWTIKKAECQRIDAFQLCCWGRLLKVPRIARSSNHSIFREINPDYSLERLMLKLKLQYFDHLMRTDDSLEKSLMLEKIEGKRRRGYQRMSWLSSITDTMNMNLGKLQEMVRRREFWWASVHGVVKSWTQLGDWATATIQKFTKLIRKKLATLDFNRSGCMIGGQLSLRYHEIN